MRKNILLVICIFSMFLVCCGKNEQTSSKSENNSVKKISVDSNAPKYKLSSSFSDWESEFAVTYTNVEMVPYLHSIHTLTVVEVINVGENPISMFDLQMNKYLLRDGVGKESTNYYELYYPEILKPTEKGYLFGYQSVFDTWSEITELELDLNFDSEANSVLREGEYVLRSCSVSDVNLNKNENNNIRLVGKVTNGSNEEFKNVYVRAVLLDKNEKPLCVVFDMVDIKAGETVEFEASATTVDAIQESDVSSWRIEAVCLE